MMSLHHLFRPAAVLLALLPLTAATVLLTPSASAAGPKPAGAKTVSVKISLLGGKTDDDLKVLRETLKQVPGIKFNADEIQLTDFGREEVLFTKPVTIELTDLAKNDVGAIGKAVAAANTARKEKSPPALYLFIRYLPASTRNEPFRAALARVKGVVSEKSWAGDANLWIQVDGSGQARLADIVRALHAAGVKFQDPITDSID